MRRRSFLTLGAAAFLAGCGRAATAPTSSATTTSRPPAPPGTPAPTAAPTSSAPPTPGTAAEVYARSTVPALCFHQIREHTADDGEYARSITTPPAVLTAQLQALADGGRTPVSASAVVDHLEFGTPLPERPVLLSFDDGSATHHDVALPALQAFGFPAIFFPMTVVLDKAGWLSADQLRALDAAGMEIGAHTWDHQRLDRLPADQWATQLAGPKATLESILGRPVPFMAYPYGAWDPEAAAQVAAAGFRAAWQLSDDTDPTTPLLTVRRLMPPPTWDGPTLLAKLDREFATP
ncbi:polysaccharide deacetylase family protein [Klenkia sp. LSe6-5]|uniref:Polysaccharide deacetylase family protein n=1 Tax=Klenkia sesuvii TaxID=3103137 RepID=A0ABU8DR71_9ACTN